MRKSFLIFALIYSLVVLIISGCLSPNALNDSFNSDSNTLSESIVSVNEMPKENKSEISFVSEKQTKETVSEIATEIEEENVENLIKTNNKVDSKSIDVEKANLIKKDGNILINFNKNAKNVTFMGNFKLTAYCHCLKCCDEYGFNRPVDENGELIVETATGTRAYKNHTIAVDPEIIPYGSTVVIEQDGIFYEYVAEDCGGAIKNRRIDIYFDSHTLANEFGIKYGKVYVIKN